MSARAPWPASSSPMASPASTHRAPPITRNLTRRYRDLLVRPGRLVLDRSFISELVARIRDAMLGIGHTTSRRSATAFARAAGQTHGRPLQGPTSRHRNQE